jgi:hypothetical protein
MSAALRIDTLKFVRKLTDAGVERPVAEAIADGLAEADTSEPATKADLAALKAELKADINAVRFEAAENKSEIFRFMMLQVATTVGLTVALIKLLP